MGAEFKIVNGAGSLVLDDTTHLTRLIYSGVLEFSSEVKYVGFGETISPHTHVVTFPYGFTNAAFTYTQGYTAGFDYSNFGALWGSAIVPFSVKLNVFRVD